jgi:hypothetical protein
MHLSNEKIVERTSSSTISEKICELVTPHQLAIPPKMANIIQYSQNTSPKGSKTNIIKIRGIPLKTDT